MRELSSRPAGVNPAGPHAITIAFWGPSLKTNVAGGRAEAVELSSRPPLAHPVRWSDSEHFDAGAVVGERGVEGVVEQSRGDDVGGHACFEAAAYEHARVG
jgi:hypothetical protein